MTRVPPLEASKRPVLVTPGADELIINEFPWAEVASTTPADWLVKTMLPLPIFPEPEMVLLTFVSVLPPTATCM